VSASGRSHTFNIDLIDFTPKPPKKVVIVKPKPVVVVPEPVIVQARPVSDREYINVTIMIIAGVIIIAILLLIFIHLCEDYNYRPPNRPDLSLNHQECACVKLNKY
jgi:hypothetical protein